MRKDNKKCILFTGFILTALPFVLWSVMQAKSKIDHLSFLYVTEKNFSFLPQDSDRSINFVMMSNVIGTLVAYNKSMDLVPNLAERWSTHDNKIIFTLKKNLYDELNEKITPQGFERSIKRNLLKFARNGSLPLFDKLKGWSSFINGSSQLKGIKTTEDTIGFEFDSKRVPDGLLDFLAMPYFGIWSDSHFNNEGKFKLIDNKAVSTGAYQVTKTNHDNTEVELVKREKNPIGSKNSFVKKVTIRTYKTIDEALTNKKNTIIATNLKSTSSNEYPGFKIISQIPGILKFAAMVPHKKGIFSSAHNRELFKGKINDYLNSKNTDHGYFTKANTFYIDANLNEHKENSRSQNTNKALKLEGNFKEVYVRIETSITPDNNNDTIENRKEKVRHIFKDIPVEIKFKEKNGRKFEKKYRNDYIDLRFGGVNTGTSIDGWVLKMMFCSSLGVDFPNPNSKICTLIDKYDQEKIALSDFSSSFEKIISDENIVIPMWHYGRKWLISNDISTKSISSVIDTVRFNFLDN